MSDLIAVVVGGVLALSGGAIGKLWESHREKRAVASALAGEISAILQMIELRGI